jgi:hypothetical protein
LTCALTTLTELAVDIRLLLLRGLQQAGPGARRRLRVRRGLTAATADSCGEASIAVDDRGSVFARDRWVRPRRDLGGASKGKAELPVG